MEAKWICGDRRLSRAIYPFLQVPPSLLACQATDNSLPLHETAFFFRPKGDRVRLLPYYLVLKFPTSLVLNAKNNLALEENVYPEFFNVFLMI